MDEWISIIIGGVGIWIICQFVYFTSKEYIYPWAMGMTSDVRIDGEYDTTFYENGKRRTEKAKLNYVGKFGRKLTGEIETDGTKYLFRGSFKNLIITAEYWNQDNAKLDRGTFTLMVTGRGSTLEGMYSWFEGNITTPIKAGKYTWKKRSK